MPVSKAQSTLSEWKKGLNTDGSVLNIAPSDFMDGTVNVEITEAGTVRRRRGIDFINQTTQGNYLSTIRTSATDIHQESVTAVFVKLSAPSGSIIERIVVDINNTFRVYEPTVAGIVNLQAPLQTISRSGHATIEQLWSPMSYASSGDKLFFASKHCKPGYLKVSDDNETLEVVYYNVIIRDLDAASEADTTRRNDYWLECKKEHYSSETNEAGDGDATEWPVYWDVMSGPIPAGTPTWSPNIHFKSRANSRVQIGGNWYECLRSHTASNSNRPGSGASWTTYWVKVDNPVGEKIIPWQSGRSYKSVNLGIRYTKSTTTTSANTYPSSVAFYAGRVWLAGDPKFPNEVLFSQVVKYDNDIEKFFQAADPYEVEDNELADDDGGTVKLLGAGLVKQMVVVGGFLFVGTTNGIYQISGAGDSTFKATDFSTNLVLNDNVEGACNMIATESEFVIFGVNNVWLSQIRSSIATTATNLAPFASISTKRIQTMYDAIPQICKKMGRAVYNQSERRIYYFFNKNRTEFDRDFQYDGSPGYATHALVLDMNFSDQENPLAFFLYEYANNASNGGPYIACPFICEDLASNGEEVTVGGQLVTVGTETVTVGVKTTTNNIIYVIVLTRTLSGTSYRTQAGTCKLSSENTVDYASSAPHTVSYSSKLIGGVQAGNTLTAKKVVPYISFLLKKIEDGTIENDVETPSGGALLRVAWNFSSSNISNKYSNAYQIYKPHRHSGFYPPSLDGHDYAWYKHRVKGRGIAFQFIIENDGDKDFHLIGYTMDLYGSQ